MRAQPLYDRSAHAFYELLDDLRISVAMRGNRGKKAVQRPGQNVVDAVIHEVAAAWNARHGHGDFELGANAVPRWRPARALSIFAIEREERPKLPMPPSTRE